MKKQPVFEEDELPPSGSYVRACILCGKEIEEPLKVAGLIYKFCSLAHKEAWETNKKSFHRMVERQLAED